ncbi:hypothetical protein JCM10212_003701 [Sporobolomyces blumeae]
MRNDTITRRLFDPASDLPHHVSELFLHFALSHSTASEFLMLEKLAATFNRCTRLRQLDVVDDPKTMSKAVKAICSSQILGRLRRLALVYPPAADPENLDRGEFELLERADDLEELTIIISLSYDRDLWGSLEEDDDEDDEDGEGDDDHSLIIDVELDVVVQHDDFPKIEVFLRGRRDSLLAGFNVVRLGRNEDEEDEEGLEPVGFLACGWSKTRTQLGVTRWKYSEQPFRAAS